MSVYQLQRDTNSYDLTTKKRTIPCPVADDPNIEFTEKFNLFSPESIVHRWPDDIYLIIEDAHPDEAPPGLTDFFSSVNLTVASKRLVQVIQSITPDVEALPVHIVYKGQQIQDEYFHLHHLKRVSGLDHEKSVFERDDEPPYDIFSVEKYVFDEAKIVGLDFFLLEERHGIIVSERLKQAIEQSGCIGCMFVPPEKMW